MKVFSPHSLLRSELHLNKIHYVAVLFPNVTAFEDRAFREVIKVKWGCRVGPWSNGTSVLIRRGREVIALRPCVHRPCEDTGSRGLYANQEGRLPQKFTLMAPFIFNFWHTNMSKLYIIDVRNLMSLQISIHTWNRHPSLSYKLIHHLQTFLPTLLFIFCLIRTFNIKI